MKVIRKQNSVGTELWFLIGEGDITFSPAVMVIDTIKYETEDFKYWANFGDIFKREVIPPIIIEKFSDKFRPVLSSTDPNYRDLGILITEEEPFKKASGESGLDLLHLLKKCRIELEGREISNDLDKFIQKTEGSLGMKFSIEETLDILESFKVAAQSGKIMEWVSHNVKAHVCDVWNCEAKITGSQIEILSLSSVNK
jgi:hypothetical protein